MCFLLRYAATEAQKFGRTCHNKHSYSKPMYNEHCIVQVQHPVAYEGRVTVSLPADEVQPLSYNVVRRPLVVQNLGIDVCSAT